MLIRLASPDDSEEIMKMTVSSERGSRWNPGRCI